MVELCYDREVVGTWNDHECDWSHKIVFIKTNKSDKGLKFLLTIGTLGKATELVEKCEEVSVNNECFLKRGSERYKVASILFNEGDTIAVLIEKE